MVDAEKTGYVAGQRAKKSTQVAKSAEPFVDLGSLLLIDRDSSLFEKSAEPTGPGAVRADDECLLELTRDNTQYLFNAMWALPQFPVEQAICVKLPSAVCVLPREKSVPAPREPTKWEKFAKEKGIIKSKKDRKVWDDETKEWRPRYGYRRKTRVIDQETDLDQTHFANRRHKRRK